MIIMSIFVAAPARESWGMNPAVQIVSLSGLVNSIRDFGD